MAKLLNGRSAPAFARWDETVDAIVIGGGMAGHCAALELVTAGADVLLLEKEAQTGGSSVLSGGSFAFAGTDLQQRHGIEDSSARLFDDLMRVGGYANDENIVRAYVDNQLDTYYWLRDHGVVYERVFLAAGQSVPRAHSRNPREVLEQVARRALASGRLRIRTEAPVGRLVRPDAAGAVEGVVAMVDGAWRGIRARRGVILASGGFSRSEQLLALFAPAQVLAQRSGGAGNTGDGLLMAWQLGAGMRDMGYVKGTFGSHPDAVPGQHMTILPVYVGAIAVNRAGQRFIDESKSYKLIGDACLQQPDAIGYQVFDQRIYAKGQRGVPIMDFQDKLDSGHLLRADSLPELARLLGVDADGLMATIAQYNAAVDAGRDEAFGRDGLSNHYGELARIETAPFYGYPSRSVVLATYCGVSVNDSMAVANVFDETIPGLWAAGEVIGGLHGNAYMTGSAIGKATIFGRLAARSMLAQGEAARTG
jgi:fumarate reductase flavoprotein subunit